MRFSNAVVLLTVITVIQAEEYVADCGTVGVACSSQVLSAILGAGGTTIKSLDMAGMATFDAGSMIKVSGVSIFPNFKAANFPYTVGESIPVEEYNTLHRRLADGYAPTSGEDDILFDLQWFHEAVGSKAAWEQGFRGQGVRVAILDGGLDYAHPDLMPNLNADDSRSFVPFEEKGYSLPDIFSHASHVAGIIGAADNGLGVIGVAPEVELIHVKVLSDSWGSGYFSWMIEGIIYAADLGVDIINMSLGALILDKEHGLDNASLQYLKVAVCNAIQYAHQKGATVIVAAGNDSINLKGEWNINFMSSCPHTISISAAGPIGWAIDPKTNLYEQASYSTYGNVDFAGPGGSYDLYFEDPIGLCTVIVTRSCFFFDFVFSTGSNGWYWAVGTSMAAPGAVGVAALLLSENPGMQSAKLKAKMANNALDLGMKGYDDFYGSGHVHSGY